MFGKFLEITLKKLRQSFEEILKRPLEMILEKSLIRLTIFLFEVFLMEIFFGRIAY